MFPKYPQSDISEKEGRGYEIWYNLFRREVEHNDEPIPQEDFYLYMYAIEREIKKLEKMEKYYLLCDNINDILAKINKDMMKSTIVAEKLLDKLFNKIPEEDLDKFHISSDGRIRYNYNITDINKDGLEVAICHYRKTILEEKRDCDVCKYLMALKRKNLMSIYDKVEKDWR